MMCPTTKGRIPVHRLAGIGLLAALMTMAASRPAAAQSLSPGTTNFGVIDLTVPVVLDGSTYFNLGTVVEETNGGLGFDQAGGGTRAFYNLAGGTYEFITNASIFSISCCATVFFENEGLVWQKGGTNITTISIPFDNLGGTNE